LYLKNNIKFFHKCESPNFITKKMEIIAVTYKSKYTILTDNVFEPLEDIPKLDGMCYLFSNKESYCQEKEVEAAFEELLLLIGVGGKTFLLIPDIEMVKEVCITILKAEFPDSQVLGRKPYNDNVFGGNDKAESVANEMKECAEADDKSVVGIEFVESLHLNTEPEPIEVPILPPTTVPKTIETESCFDNP